MKRNILTLILLTFALSSQSQIITGTTYKAIPCCAHSDSLDIDGDNIFEFKANSWVGIDNYNFSSIPYPNVETNGTVLYGASFPNTWWNVGLPSTIFSGWVGWLPGDGFKYGGFRRVNGIADTTYGWIKFDFVGDVAYPPTNDTLIILEYGYNLTPNSPIWAGETTPTGTQEINKAKLNIDVRQNHNDVVVFNPNNKLYDLAISDINGRTIFKRKSIAEHITHCDLSKYPTGIFIVSITSKQGRFSQKILKR